MSPLILPLLLLVPTSVPVGTATLQLDLPPARLAVFTYKPARFKDGAILIVFHGVNRNADEYRDHARAMGDRFGMLVVAPRFDVAQFGPGMYQQGGLFQDKKLAPAHGGRGITSRRSPSTSAASKGGRRCRIT